MAQSILALRRDTETRYVLWSTVSDAPVSYGLTEAELTEYVQREEGRRGVEGLARAMDRVRAIGTSSLRRESPEDVVAGNRAGPGESELTYEEIVEQYWDAPQEEPAGASGPSDGAYWRVSIDVHPVRTGDYDPEVLAAALDCPIGVMLAVLQEPL